MFTWFLLYVRKCARVAANHPPLHRTTPIRTKMSMLLRIRDYPLLQNLAPNASVRIVLNTENLKLYSRTPESESAF